MGIIPNSLCSWSVFFETLILLLPPGKIFRLYIRPLKKLELFVYNLQKNRSGWNLSMYT